MAVNRVAKELGKLLQKLPEGVTHLIGDKDDPLHWTGVMRAVEKPFAFDVRFPDTYPFAPPTVTFSTPVRHPNVDDKGLVCLRLIDPSHWVASIMMEQVLMELLGLIHELEPTARAKCPKADAKSFVQGLGIDDVYFNPDHDRCYCSVCYPADWPDTIANQGPTRYVVPRGWVRFGLHLHPRAISLKIFDLWSVSFHGVKSKAVLRGVLDSGGLLKPGDRLLDGSVLKSTKCAGRQDTVFYTSPTITYAGLKFYAEPQKWRDGTMCASIALQCRQKPHSFRTQGETMRFEREWPGHLARTCPHVDLKHIEWLSEVNMAAIPYGLLVRVWPDGHDPDAEVYKSPVDF